MDWTSVWANYIIVCKAVGIFFFTYMQCFLFCQFVWVCVQSVKCMYIHGVNNFNKLLNSFQEYVEHWNVVIYFLALLSEHWSLYVLLLKSTHTDSSLITTWIPPYAEIYYHLHWDVCMYNSLYTALLGITQHSQLANVQANYLKHHRGFSHCLLRMGVLEGSSGSISHGAWSHPPGLITS